MDIYQISQLIHTKESTIQFLQQRSILRSVPPRCPSCNQPMSESRRVSRGDGIVWRCSRRHQGAPRCNIKQALGHGSFLANSNLEPRQFVMLAYFWAHGISASSQAEMCSVSEHSGDKASMYVNIHTNQSHITQISVHPHTNIYG